jgi:hypothetical protein
LTGAAGTGEGAAAALVALTTFAGVAAGAAAGAATGVDAVAVEEEADLAMIVFVIHLYINSF